MLQNTSVFEIICAVTLNKAVSTPIVVHGTAAWVVVIRFDDEVGNGVFGAAAGLVEQVEVGTACDSVQVVVDERPTLTLQCGFILIGLVFVTADEYDIGDVALRPCRLPEGKKGKKDE